MYTFLDLMQSAQILDKAQPHSNVVVRDSKIVMSYEWLLVTFEPDEVTPSEHMVMTVKAFLTEDVPSLTARVELEQCYNTEPSIVGTIATTTLRQIAVNHVEAKTLDKMANFIDVLFSGIKYLPVNDTLKTN